MAVRSDLYPGAQLAQSFHAGIDFSVKYPQLTAIWHAESNNVVIVAVPNEAALYMLESVALSLGVKHHLVREPDISDEATAIALEPGPLAKRMCSDLPLALKQASMTVEMQGKQQESATTFGVAMT